MKEQKNNRNKWLHIRISEDELQRIGKGYAATKSTVMSDYLRKLILGKPHIGRYRNESLDDFVTVLGQLKMELKAAGNNLNQAVKKLHTLNKGNDLERWLVTWELDKRSFQKSVEAIAAHMDKINDQWLQ